MRMRFYKPDLPNVPRLLAQGELVFDESEGRLNGLKLKNFAIWGGSEKSDKKSVTFPSIKREGGNYWLLRKDFEDDDDTAMDRVKAWVLEEYEKWRTATGKKTR